MPSADAYLHTTLDSTSGGLHLQQLVGSGRFAAVYAARDPAGATLAVKVLTRRDRQGLLRFRREIAVMQQLPPHPNRVAYLGHGQAPDGAPWLSMDFVDGFNLRAVLARGQQIPEATALALMIQLCDGFQGLHTLGLTHRDVNPDNVMITNARRQVKIMDFGLIRDAQGILELFEKTDGGSHVFSEDIDAGLVAGTPEYMAPEQITDALNPELPTQTDTTADIFALGAILFELLAGHQLFPFAAGARGATDRAHAVRNYLDYRLAFGPDDYPAPDHVGAELWSILRKALHPNPNARQRDAAELAGDLRFFVETGQGVLEDDLSETIAQPSSLILSRLRPAPPRPEPPSQPAALAPATQKKPDHILSTGQLRAERTSVVAHDGGRSEPSQGLGVAQLETLRPQLVRPGPDIPAQARALDIEIRRAGAPVSAPTAPQPQARRKPSALPWLLAALAILGLGAILIVVLSP